MNTFYITKLGDSQNMKVENIVGDSLFGKKFKNPYFFTTNFFFQKKREFATEYIYIWP
jgi:hypothetical protein